MRKKEGARQGKDTETDQMENPHVSDEDMLSLYARLLEPLAGRDGREIRVTDWRGFREQIPTSIRATHLAHEYTGRLNRPEAVILLLDLAYGPRVSRLARDLGVSNTSLVSTIERAGELLRGSLSTHKVIQGRAVQPPRSEGDIKLATSALGEVDRMRAALVRRAASATGIHRARLTKEVGHEAPDTEGDGRPGTQITLGGRLSSRELARHYGLDPERVRKALDRYRIGHDEAWIEVRERRPREPKYLYDPTAVATLLEGMMDA